MGRTRLASAIALAGLILLSGAVSGATSFGRVSFSSGSGKVVNMGLLDARAAAQGSGGSLAARGSNAPKSDGTCFPASCTGPSLVGTGDALGLGNADGVIRLEANAVPIVSCTNQGGNMAPGVNLPGIVLSGEDSFGGTEISRNGKLTFGVSTPTDQIGVPLPNPASTYGCPNDNWTAKITAYQFTSATLIALQNDKNGVLIETARNFYPF